MCKYVSMYDIKVRSVYVPSVCVKSVSEYVNFYVFS